MLKPTGKDNPAPETLRVDILCTGLDRIRRGYESFARECFDALREDPRVDLRLYKGSGSKAPGEKALRCLHRESLLAALIGRATHRSAYHVEQITFLASYLSGLLRRDAPNVVFTSDANLANFLSRWRRKTGAGYGILYSNGGPISPPFPEYDHVQQVAKPYLEEALACGEPATKHSLVPYGIHIPSHLVEGAFADPTECRSKLGLPVDRKIVLSVGYVSATHKRMDHVVREIAHIPEGRRPFLVLLGQQDASTNEIRSLAQSLLGPKGFLIASAPYQEVATYYGAADIFVLASLKEGFGRVLLEASAHGLPCVTDDNPVMRYVLGALGHFVRMKSSGALSERLLSLAGHTDTRAERLSRVEDIHARFSWEVLREPYLRMFAELAKERRERQ